MLTKLHKIILSSGFALALGSAALYYGLNTSQAAGIPTIDAAAISQMVKEFSQMEKEFDQLLKQYQELQQQTDRLTNIKSRLEGITGIADLLRQENVLELFPDLVNVEQITDLTFETIPAAAQNIYRKRGFEHTCSLITDSDSQKLCEQSGAYISTTEYAYDAAAQKVQKRIINLEKMVDQLEQCTSAKQTADLQTRIQAELGFIQISQLKTQLLKERMQAAMDGVQRQQQMKLQRYLFG